MPKSDGVDEIDDVGTNAAMVPPITKAHLAKDMKRYTGFASTFTSWRKRLDTTLAKDDSPAAPLFMIEGRRPTAEEKEQLQAPYWQPEPEPEHSDTLMAFPMRLLWSYLSNWMHFTPSV
jgi:hypothetical protein